MNSFLLRFSCLWLSLLILLPSAMAGIPVVDRIRFLPSPGKAQQMQGARFEGSNTSSNAGFVTLAEIKDMPAKEGWQEIKVDNKEVFRWLRFTQPQADLGKLAKAEFYAGEQLLASEDKNGMRYWFFNDDVQDDRTIGYDLFAVTAAPRPAIKPDNLNPTGPVEVTLHSSRDAKIRYTLDGSWPTEQNGLDYTAPLKLDRSTTISATAFAPGRTSGPPVCATYLLPGSSQAGLTTAHLGNSLTGTAANFWRYARTAGYDHKQANFLRPGALTRELWALVSGDYANDKLASAKEKQAQGRGSENWQTFWDKIGKVDVLTLQPRDFDLDMEVGAEIAFIKKFQEKSPDVQPWIYCEWVEQKRQRPSDRGEVPSYQMKKTFPALSWEESMSAMLLYAEEVQHRLVQKHGQGKRPRIIPAALAMGWIKNKIDRGQFGDAKPGTFYQMLFRDQVHPASSAAQGSANGGYLVDLTWHSALYRESPAGRVLPVETTFSPEQVRQVETLAWDAVKNYPDCGLYDEGKEPCATPKFNSDGKTITLSSNTPGTWFRYTLDGTTPTRTCGYVYCGKISVQPGIQVKVVAYKSGMADSEAAELK